MTSVWRAAICAVVVLGWAARPGGEGILARLWQDPGPMSSRDLRWGAGSAERAPKAPFAFVEHGSGGTQPKVVVADSAGVRWDVKFGEEVHAEVAASRLVWALGYYVDEVYFVGDGVIAGFDAGGRVEDYVDASGTFRDARFERRQDHHQAVDAGWGFAANPFTGTRELSGLKILMALIGNWDIEGARNNRLVEVREPGKEPYRQYFVGDLGATFGRMGARMTNHSKWNLEDYRGEGFIDQVDDKEVEFDYDGLEGGLDKVPLEHARWFADLLGQLTATQVRQAFEAAGATPEEVDGFSQVVLARIGALREAVGRPPATRGARPTAPAPAA
jgi:hypothetical protein